MRLIRTTARVFRKAENHGVLPAMDTEACVAPARQLGDGAAGGFLPVQQNLFQEHNSPRLIIFAPPTSLNPILTPRGLRSGQAQFFPLTISSTLWRSLMSKVM